MLIRREIASFLPDSPDAKKLNSMNPKPMVKPRPRKLIIFVPLVSAAPTIRPWSKLNRFWNDL